MLKPQGFSVFSELFPLGSEVTLLWARNCSQRRCVPESSCPEHPSEQQKNHIPYAAAYYGDRGYLLCIHHLRLVLDRLLDIGKPPQQEP